MVPNESQWSGPVKLIQLAVVCFRKTGKHFHAHHMIMSHFFSLPFALLPFVLLPVWLDLLDHQNACVVWLYLRWRGNRMDTTAHRCRHTRVHAAVSLCVGTRDCASRPPNRHRWTASRHRRPRRCPSRSLDRRGRRSIRQPELLRSYFHPLIFSFAHSAISRMAF